MSFVKERFQSRRTALRAAAIVALIGLPVLVWGGQASGLSWSSLPWAGHPEVTYNEDIRPIFNERCIACHGGVKREEGLSLLFRTDALADTTDAGEPVIASGHPGESELMRRVTHSDPDERMPPEGDPLTDEETAKLEAWIAQGAPWEKHWAYVPPQKPPLPETGRFGANVKSAGVSTGGDPGESDIEPSRGGIDRFVRARLAQEDLQPSPPADCRRLMRRLHLDLVGLPPSPECTDAFCRNASRAAYEQVVDRLLASERFGEHWASMWLDLARYANSQGYEKDAHRSIWKYRDWVIRAFNSGMPFDRFTTQQLAGDLLPDPSKEQLVATAFHRNTTTNAEGGTVNEEFRVAAVIDRVNTTMEVWQGTTMECVQCHSHPYDPFRHKEYYELYAFFNNTADADRDADRPRIPTFSEKKKKKGLKLRADIDVLRARLDSLLATSDLVKKRRAWESEIQKALASSTDDLELDRSLLPIGGDELTRVMKIINTPAEERSVSGQAHVVEVFGKYTPALEPLQQKLQEKQEALLALDPVFTPVMQELPEGHGRETHVFMRGNWLTRGEKVSPGVPNSLNDWPERAKKNRLGLARWLVSEENPLTARVTVNRLWAQLFGRGLVKTLGDFGTQGARPTHPELLDWLAVRFMQTHDWHVKPLLRDIVLSATYRQSSRLTPALEAQDPRNRLLARGPRVRLSAEQVRDQALAVSGLLSDKMYGPSVMPPQPEGIWNSPYSGYEWETSTGEDRYRRALYTYWRRTSPYPSMVAFDAPSRQGTVSRRVRTNTPLQALVTLNDPVYVEAARALADRMIERGSEGAPKRQIKAGYRLALQRTPDGQTVAVLRGLYEDALARYRGRPEEAKKLTGIGPQEAAGPERAALTVVANAIMNLDAFIMKQ